MTDSRITPGSGRIDMHGEPPRLQVHFGADQWQFFAFVFAATTSLVFALLDQLPAWTPGCRAAILKFAVFAVLGYATLFNLRVKNWLIRVLPVIRLKEAP